MFTLKILQHNVMHIMYPIFSSKVITFSIWTKEKLCCSRQSNESKAWNMFTVKACARFNNLDEIAITNNVYLCLHSQKTKTLCCHGWRFLYIYYLRLSEVSSFRRKKFSMRNKLYDVQAFLDRVKSVASCMFRRKTFMYTLSFRN